MDKKIANILLLSDKDFDYNTLVEAGYKNVFWFKSTLRACEYFKDREDILEKFDIILMGNSSLIDIDHYKYSNLFFNVINREDIPYMCFFSSIFEEEDAVKRFYISYPDLTRNGVLAEQFLSILNDSIPEELKGEVIEIPEIEEKEIVLPKKREDVKVLFMGYLINQGLVKKFFKEAGFTNYGFIRSNNFTLRDNVESLADYDLVVVDEGFNGSLILLGDEFQDYMKDKGKSIYFVAYNFDYRESNNNIYYMRGLSTENPENEEFVRFNSMEDEENALKDLMGTVINLYTSYNKNVGESGYPTKEELDEKYNRQYDEFVKENRIIAHNKSVVDYIKTMVEKYRIFYNKNQRFGHMLSDLKGLKIDVLKDGVSVAFLVGNKECVRITFKDDENTDDTDFYLEFYLEYLNEKGNKLCSPVKRICNSSYCVKKSPDYPSDEEIKKIKAIYMRIQEELQPKIDKIEESIIIRSSNNRRNKNKKYYKRYV